MEYAIGLMSGTSLDGVDACLVQLDGKFTFVDGITLSYDETLKKRIIASLDIEKSSNKLLTEINFEIGQALADAAISVANKNDISIKDISFIASHGQTIWHNPKNKDNLVNSTMQLGESSVIAYQTKVTVVSDFRVMDMAAGGQGAPLVPFADYFLHHSTVESNIFLNIGGISNITYLKKSGSISDVIAFDTGPGNVLIDAAMKHFYNKDYDESGKTAKSGKIMKELFVELMSHEYLKEDYPKSTGRESFGNPYLHYLINKYQINKITAKDFIHTLSCFTAASIVEGISLVTSDVSKVIVAGGGAKNKFIMDKLTQYAKLTVITYDDFGFNSNYKEAIAFVVLGFQTLHKLPSNLPSVTGANETVILGKITQI